ncbi:MAG: hypothetical protein ACI9LO_002369 [Planctomycetota bacterium]|jgi:hypothetical protein
MAAAVVDDTSNQTLTLTFGYKAGLAELYDWTVNFTNGISDLRSMSLISFDASGFGDEISRRNYY